MDKEKSQKRLKTAHPRRYPQEIVDKTLSLIRQGKDMKEILQQVPCKKSAVRRYARKAGLKIKKKE